MNINKRDCLEKIFSFQLVTVLFGILNFMCLRDEKLGGKNLGAKILEKW